MRFIIGFSLSVVVFLSFGCQRSLPEGDGEIVGKLIAYDKPAIGYEIRFYFQTGFTKTIKTDSAGLFVFRIPRAKYRLKTWSIGSEKNEDWLKEGSEYTLYENIRENFPRDSNGIQIDLISSQRIVLPPFYISRRVFLNTPDNGAVINDTSKSIFAWSKPGSANSYRFLIGRAVKQEPIHTRISIRYLSMGADSDGSLYWVPVDTIFLVKDTTLAASFVLQHIPKPSVRNPRYFWGVIACDSAGYHIAGSVYNKSFYRITGEVN